jgi:hypothetical protein
LPATFALPARAVGAVNYQKLAKSCPASLKRFGDVIASSPLFVTRSLE